MCRYGYTPLPRTIPQDSLDARIQTFPDGPEDWESEWQQAVHHLHPSSDEAALSSVAAIARKSLGSFALKWYSLDENAISPVYVLQNLKDINDPLYWKVALPVLLEALLSLCSAF